MDFLRFQCISLYVLYPQSVRLLVRHYMNAITTRVIAAQPRIIIVVIRVQDDAVLNTITGDPSHTNLMADALLKEITETLPLTEEDKGRVVTRMRVHIMLTLDLPSSIVTSCPNHIITIPTSTIGTHRADHTPALEVVLPNIVMAMSVARGLDKSCLIPRRRHIALHLQAKADLQELTTLLLVVNAVGTPALRVVPPSSVITTTVAMHLEKPCPHTTRRRPPAMHLQAEADLPEDLLAVNVAGVPSRLTWRAEIGAMGATRSVVLALGAQDRVQSATSGHLPCHVRNHMETRTFKILLRYFVD
jgi:hypothetical protein